MLTNEELIQTPEYWLDNIQNELFRQVKRFMDVNHMNQSEFAEKLQVTRGYVSQILNGNFNYTVKKLIELSLAMGVVPDLEFRSFAEYLSKEYNNLMDGKLVINADEGVLLKGDNKNTVTDNRSTGILIQLHPMIGFNYKENSITG